MRKITFVNKTFNMGGPARVCCIWGKSLLDLKHDVELLSDFHENRPISYNFTQRSIFGKSKKSNIITLTYNLFKIINKEDRLFVFNKGDYIIPLFFCKFFLGIKNSKLVYFVHGGTKNFKTYYGNLRTIIMHLTFDKVICLYENYNTDHNYFPKKSFFRKITDLLLPNSYKFIKTKIFFIPNPVNIGIDDLNLKERKKVILSVGRLDEIKRFDLLIRLFNDIKDDIKNWNLEIAGNGDEYDYLKKIIVDFKLSDRVKLLGEIKNIDPLYRRASIFTLASKFEGMPMVILEAIEYGLPVIGFKNDGTDFLIQNDYNGYKSDLNDFNDFKKNLIELANNKNKRELYGRNAKISSKKYHKITLLKKWEDLIANI